MKKLITTKALFLLLWGLVLCVVPLTGVYAGTITFDEFPANNNNVPITNLYAPIGVIFASDNSGTWDGLSNGNPGNWGLEGTNGPSFLGNNGLNNSGTYVTSIFFSAPVSNVSFDVSRSNGSSPGQTLTASVYEGATLLGSLTVTLGNINNWSLITFGLGGIDKVILDGSDVGLSPYGVDNLQFTAGAVPEPATMLLIGSGLLGLLGFRRKFKK
jgi:hypothetical protein